MFVLQIILLSVVGLFAIVSSFHLGVTLIKPSLRAKMLKQGIKDKIAGYLADVFERQDYPLPQRNALINQMSEDIDRLELDENKDDSLIGLCGRIYFCDLLKWLSLLMLSTATTGEHIIVVFIFIIGLLYAKKLIHELIMEHTIDMIQPVVDKLPIQSADDIWQ